MPDPKAPAAKPQPKPGVPKQALAGGGSETQAGSDEGGSAYGDDREDDDKDGDGVKDKPATP